MLIDFFLRLKSARIPVTVREFLVLIEALQKGLSFGSVDEFYLLARLCLIKDESHYDKFDRIFANYFNGAEDPGDEVTE